MSIAPRLPVLVVFFCCVAGDVAHAQTELRWKLEPGQALRYRFEHRSLMTIDVPDQKLEQDYTLRVDLEWKVLEVRPDGRYRVAQRVERVTIDVKGGDQPLTYDSREGTARGEGVALLKELYGKLIDSTTELVLDRDGSIVEARVAAPVAEAVRGTQYAAVVDGGSLLSSEGVRVMLGQVLPRFPSRPVAVGETWEAQLEPIRGPLVSMRVGLKYRADAIEQGQARLGSTLAVEVAATRGVQLDVAVEDQQGSGEYSFDVEHGRLTRSRVGHKLKLVFGKDERAVRENVEISTGLTLLE